MQLRVSWWYVALPAILIAFAVGLAIELHVAWTAPRLALAIGIGAAAIASAMMRARERLIAGPFGLETRTWRGKTGFVWEDVERFHCDGKRLVLLDHTGAAVFELSAEEPYDRCRPFMQHVIAELRRRRIVERRRDALVMTAVQIHRLDLGHRWWPATFIVLAVASATVMQLTPSNVVAVVGLAALGIALCALCGNESITIGPRGIVERGWILTDEVTWGAVFSFQYTEDRDLLSPGSADGLTGLILLALLAPITFPVRGLVRLLIYGKRSRRFYYGRLELLDARGKRLWLLKASTGHADIEDAFDRILDELAERQVSFAAAA